MLVRVWLGFGFLNAGLHKIFGTGWMDGGASLKAFWERATAVSATGSKVVAFDWYRDFLQMLLDDRAWSWFAPFVAFGETAIGLGLITGTLTGVAAAFAGFMSWNFMMAGTASVNPVYLPVAALIVIAYVPAGYFGLDRWLLPNIGTPWTFFEEHVFFKVVAWAVYAVVCLGLGVNVVQTIFAFDPLNTLLPLKQLPVQFSTALGWLLGVVPLWYSYKWTYESSE